MQWVDYIIFTDMLDPVSNKYLFEIVTTFQTQWLLKTCKNIEMRSAVSSLGSSYRI